MVNRMNKMIISTIAMAMLIACQNEPAIMKERVNDGSVEVLIYPDEIKKTISTYMTGFNLSYYRDKDDIWENNNIAQKLKDVKAGILRYPGGGETSYFHWQYPGAPGYRDALNSEHTVDKDNALKNPDRQMDTDKYIEWCRIIDCEPLLGFNLKSGFVRNDMDDALREAKEWLTYCNVEKGYNVKYWYLDNELNNKEYKLINMQQYAEIINRFVPELKAIDPSIKIIVNPIGNGRSQAMKDIVRLAAENFDIIDLHYYYDWGNVTWDRWLNQYPLKNEGATYVDDVKALSKIIKTSKNPNIKLASLEWNVAPPAEVVSNYKQVLMQTEMFQQFIESDLEMACVWPLLWDQPLGRFPSLLNQQTYEPAPLYYVYKLYTDALGQQLIHSLSSDQRIISQSVLRLDGQKMWVYLINKSENELKVKANVKSGSFTKAIGDLILSEDIEAHTCLTEKINVDIQRNIASVVMPAFSIVRVELTK